MNEQQAFAAIRNAIRLENLGRDVAAKVTPELTAIFKQVRELIGGMPAEAIMRDSHYRRVLMQLAPLFRGVNDRLYLELTNALQKEVVEQAHWAQSFLRIAELNPERTTGGVTTIQNARLRVSSLTRTATGYGATVSQMPVASLGPATFELGSAVTRTQLMALVDETEVLGKRLTQLFGLEDFADSPFIGTQLKRIDRTVKQGFLAGETNEQIAQNIGKLDRIATRDARAVARTAVMDMSQRAHEQMWDANAEVIVLWEFDATFDYRVCPQCFPYDGKRAKDRGNLPSVPRHPNCRCRVLPLTATSLALEKKDMKDGITISTVQVGKPSHTRGDTKPREYKTKAKVNGKRVPKFSQDYEVPRGERPTMAFFLTRANNETRQAVLGVENAKRFGAMLESMNPEDALREIIAHPYRRRK
jgi:SPP1 gp7 family putative phage head morphogenesis protein